MGGMDFALIMKDGKKFHYTLGNLVDFIFYPEGYGPADILDVESGFSREIHLRGEGVLHGPHYAWCLYEEPKVILEQIQKETPLL